MSGNQTIRARSPQAATKSYFRVVSNPRDDGGGMPKDECWPATLLARPSRSFTPCGSAVVFESTLLRWKTALVVCITIVP